MKASYSLALTCLFLTGCANSPFSDLSWDKTADAARRAALAPETWAPLAGAAVIAAADRDHSWQSSLAEHKPVFGDNAESVSDDLKDASTALYAVSAMFAEPPGSSAAEALEWKAWNVAVLVVDREGLDSFVNSAKEWSGRDRPDGEPDDAMPSAHSAITTLQTSMTRRNLDYIDMDNGLRTAFKAGLYTIDGLEAVARMESDKHYPTDVLVGMALGSFVSNFTFNLLLEKPYQHTGNLMLIPVSDGAVLQYTKAW